MDNKEIVDAINGLNATIRRQIFAYEHVNGITMGPRGYFSGSPQRYGEYQYTRPDELDQEAN